MKEQVAQIEINDFDFHLPDGQIAYKPAGKREASRLLRYSKGDIFDDSFKSLPENLDSGDLLIYNNTKVIHARLGFEKETGARIEIFCLDPTEPHNHEEALACHESCTWKCYVGNAKKWKQGAIFSTQFGKKLQAELLGREGDAFVVRFSWSGGDSFAEILQQAGDLPLPPYIKREATDEDEKRYQTVYAQHEGSVAAPTAGLHFTKQIQKDLEDKGVSNGYVTLHVGAGTFKPVTSEHIGDHEMHREVFFVDAELVEAVAKCSGKVIPVGTTSMRALESIYWIGVKLLEGIENPFEIDQWYAYEESASYSAKEALDAVLAKCRQLNHPIQCSTAIVIAPGYTLRVCNGLITNFHLPKSTLLLLVCALIGSDWQRVYQHAVKTGYRFLSYGDSSLLIP